MTTVDRLRDVNRDGRPDPTGRLSDGQAAVYHATDPDSFGDGRQFGSGWNIFTYVDFADINHDG